MALSTTGIRSALAAITEQVWLECLTISHPDIPEVGNVIRVVNDTKDLVRTAGTFIAFPFTYTDFVRADDQTITAAVEATNVDQRISRALRGLAPTARPTVMYELVLAATPNTVEAGPITFICTNFTSNISVVQLSLTFDMNLLNNAFPKDYFAPWNAA